MYHYVRPKNKNFPALDIDDFKKQINLFKKKGRIIDNLEFNYIIKNNKFNKEPNFLLTFDDGYKDHYEYVFPYLKKKKITGNFYVPTCIWKNKKSLDINKIHMILNKVNDHTKLLNYIYSLLGKDLESKFRSNFFLNKIVKNRYDKFETILIKRFLQYLLPCKTRYKILNALFNKIVNISEKEFIKNTYLTINQAKEMSKNNMHFGSHGESHVNFRLLSLNQQLLEITNSIKFMKKNGIVKNNLSLCYPWGEFNHNSKKLFNKILLDYGLTVLPGSINQNSKFSKYFLPRYDANDFLTNL